MYCLFDVIPKYMPTVRTNNYIEYVWKQVRATSLTRRDNILFSHNHKHLYILVESSSWKFRQYRDNNPGHEFPWILSSCFLILWPSSFLEIAHIIEAISRETIITVFLSQHQQHVIISGQLTSENNKQSHI